MRARTRAGLWLAALVSVAGLSAGAAAAPQLVVQPGQPFPDLAFDGLLERADYVALGLDPDRPDFRLSDISGDLLVLEFFNRFCLTCRRQAPYLQKVFDGVRDGPLAGRVRVLAVGVGNRVSGLAAFRSELGVSYPMAADPLFDRLFAVGDPGGTPFTVFLVRRGGVWLLGDYHLGLQGDVEILARSNVLLEDDGVARAKTARRTGRFHPPLGLSEEDQRLRAAGFLSRVAGGPVPVDTVTAGDGVRVYRALDADGEPTGLYARIASRAPVCDVCHAVHFLLAFDRDGRVRGFEPIHVTKFGNREWSDEDAARLEAALDGRPMAGLAFDPAVDAVTSATMSSALIFDEARRSARLLADLVGR